MFMLKFLRVWSVAVVLGASGLNIALGASAAKELIPEDGSCWDRFAPRAQNAPAGELQKRGNSYTLTSTSAGKRHAYGGWRCRVEGLDGSGYYRVRVQARPRGFASRDEVRESVGVQIRWRGGFGEEVAPTYAWLARELASPAGMYEFERVVQAPPRSRALDLELVLQWTPTGHVEWQSISLQPTAAPAPRNVRVATVWLRPRNSPSGADSVRRFAEYLDRVAPEHHPDVILLGEMINRVGAAGELDELAEIIPGPTTEQMSERARRYGSWIVFSMVERDGADLFNTGVLIDRAGRIAGKYRKVQLPFEEVSRGIAPGSEFPVFITDFGRLGILICHDASFPDAARELVLNGAEMILMPIWGGRETLVRARAIENGVHVVTSGYDYPSEIISPTGDVLAAVPVGKGPAVAVRDIDLNQRFRQDWIGDWNDTYQRQQRPAAYRRR
jgi:predicted amidohydrolase